MRPAWGLLMASAGVLLAGAARAGEFSFDPALSAGEFTVLAETVADVITFPNVGPAEPGGVTGFDVLAVAGGPQVDTGEGWWQHAVVGDTTAGVFYGTRVVGRKGLPFAFDVGAQVGEVLGERFWGVEGKWAFVKGGTISPALALRVSYSRLDGAPLDLKTGEVQAVISKGFAMLTPYAAFGYRRVEAEALAFTAAEDRVTGAVGVRLSVVPFRLVGEVRQGLERGIFIGLGVGL